MDRRQYQREWMRAAIRKDPDKFRAQWRRSNERRKDKQKAWKASDRTKHREKYRARRLLQDYGLTLDEYKAMLKAQRGCCAICKTPDWGGRWKTRLSVREKV